MRRFAPQMVFLGLVTIWSLATPPTSRSPLPESATTEGRIRFPRSVGTTFGIRLRTEAAHVLVVPRSIPTMRVFSAMDSGLDCLVYHVTERARRSWPAAPPRSLPEGSQLGRRRFPHGRRGVARRRQLEQRAGHLRA